MKLTPLVGKQLTSVNLAFNRMNIWEGSVRSSKTICSLFAWIRFVLTAPAGNLLMVGKTERTLKRNILDVLEEMLPKGSFKHNIGTSEVFIYGRRIYIAGANDERAGDRIRGMTLVGTYVDEISVLPESFFIMLTTRLSLEGASLFGTTNPDSPRHWLLDSYLNRPSVWVKHDGTIERAAGNLDLARFSFNLDDNPNLAPAYVAALKMEHTGLWYKRLIQGLWVLAEGAIYDQFDSDVGGPHVVQLLPEMESWWMGIDYGTTNPFVALLVGASVPDEFNKQRLYVAREWRWDSKKKQKQLSDSEYADKLRDWLSDLAVENITTGRVDTLEGLVEKTYVDPSATSFAVQLHRTQWRGVHHADNSVEDGIRSVSTLLNAGLLKFHESCTGTISEMSAYVWDDKAQQRGEDKPMKVDDHGPDALRYAIHSRRRAWRNWTTGVLLDDDAA